MLLNTHKQLKDYFYLFWLDSKVFTYGGSWEIQQTYEDLLTDFEKLGTPSCDFPRSAIYYYDMYLHQAEDCTTYRAACNQIRI
jgi:hypothetical protein